MCIPAAKVTIIDASITKDTLMKTISDIVTFGFSLGKISVEQSKKKTDTNIAKTVAIIINIVIIFFIYAPHLYLHYNGN